MTLAYRCTQPSALLWGMAMLYDPSATTLPDGLQPRLLTELDARNVSLNAAEIGALYTLHRAGYAVAPILVVPAAVEERFYRLNNLPEQLNSLFAGINLSDPDEDDIEELAPEAMQLFQQHYLLDEFIDAFYEALGPLAPTLKVRRAGAAGQPSAKGRPTLLALKALWAADWSFEALMARLAHTRSIALEARPVLISPADEASVLPAEAAALAERLGVPVQAWQAGGELCRLQLMSPTGATINSKS